MGQSNEVAPSVCGCYPSVSVVAFVHLRVRTHMSSIPSLAALYSRVDSWSVSGVDMKIGGGSSSDMITSKMYWELVTSAVAKASKSAYLWMTSQWSTA